MSSLTQLPQEIKFQIMDYLEPYHLRRLRITSKEFKMDVRSFIESKFLSWNSDFYHLMSERYLLSCFEVFYKTISIERNRVVNRVTVILKEGEWEENTSSQ